VQDGENDQGGDNPDPLGSPEKRIRESAPCAFRAGKNMRCQDKTGPEEPAAGVGYGSDANIGDGAQVGGWGHGYG
jgi:hypothetical protein